MTLTMERGSALTLRCDRDLIRAAFFSAGTTYTWWTDEVVIAASEGDQVLTFDRAVHLGISVSRGDW